MEEQKEQTTNSEETQRLQEKIAKQKTKELHNLSPKLLVALYYCPNITYEKLSELTGLDLPKTRTYIQRLESKEMLEKERLNPNEMDLRKVLKLTDKGVEEAKKYLDFLNSKKDLIRELETKKYIHESWQENLKEYLDLDNIRGLIFEAKRLSKSLSIDHYDMAKWNPEVGDFALAKPQEFFIVCRAIIKSKYDFNPYIKLHNITSQIKVPLRKISKQHLDKFYSFEGVIKFYSDNTPYVENVQWGCNLCGFKWWEKILDNSINKPKKCANPNCKGLNCWYIADEESHDRHYLLLEETQDHLGSGKQPSNLLCYVERELAGDDVIEKIQAGRKVKINGIVKKKPKYKFNKLTNEFRLVVKVSDVELLEGDVDDFELTEEEDKTCKMIFEKMRSSFDEGFEMLCKNFDPLLIGIDHIKEAVMLQMVCGKDLTDGSGMKWRNKIHILLVGDPGTGKTKLARYICGLTPNSRFAVGTSSSGIGITASIRKEQELGVNIIEAGKVVMANGSLCCIDEFDKLEKEDKNRLLECMENSTVTIDKAGLSRSMKAETCILALANPVSGDFTSPSDMLNEINLQPAVRQRFDLIFILREFNTEEMDRKVVDAMINKGTFVFSEGFNNELLRKYFWGVKNLPEPKMGVSASNALKELFVRLRVAARSKYGDSSTAVGKRIVNTYQRMAKCYAKFRGSKVVEDVDIMRAHQLVRYAFVWALSGDGDEMDLDTSLLYSDESKKVISERQAMRRLFADVYERLGEPVGGVELAQVFKEKNYSESSMWDFVKGEKERGNIIEVRPDKFILSK